MKSHMEIISALLIAAVFYTCDNAKGETDYSGVYCLNIENLEMTLIQNGKDVTFSFQTDLLTDGTGEINGDSLILTAYTAESELFTSRLQFAPDKKSFSGQFRITNTNGMTMLEGILQGDKGKCASIDIETNGIPKFIGKDFTQLSRIEMISRFRSGFGHSYTDGFESCRSMKHYYNPYANYRENKTVEIYSPVTGTIISVLNDGHGASIGLNNKQLQIRSDDQPAFTIVIFHTDLLSSDITTGKKVQAGELIGHARMYYEDLYEYSTSFDIAVRVNATSGLKLIPYFDTMTDALFNNYVARGVSSRQEFTITKEERDANPLQCNGESFVSGGTIENWVILE